MQDKIDQLRRQNLVLKALSCILENQLNGAPKRADGEFFDLQNGLKVAIDVETASLDEEVDRLVAMRDRR